MSMNRKEAIKQTALLMGGCAFVPSAMGVLKGCTPGSLSDVTGVGNGDPIIGDGDPIDESKAIFNSVSALRTTPGEVGEIAALTGYYEADDGGGTIVNWDKDSTEDDDGGMIFKVDGVSTGRWKRPDVGEINVKWFGARGDGVDRLGSESDVKVFDKVLDWIASNTIKTIYIPAGTYMLQHTIKRITHKHNGLEMYGDGYDSEIKLSDNPDWNAASGETHWIIKAPQNSTGDHVLENLFFHHFRINGNYSVNGGESSLMRLQGNRDTMAEGEETFNIRVEDMHAHDAGDSCFAMRVSNLVMKRIKAWDCLRHGIGTNTGINVYVQDFEAWGCGMNGGSYGLDFSSGYNLVCEDFYLHENYNGFKTSSNIRGAELINGRIINSIDRNMRQTGAAHPDNTLVLTDITTENAGKDGNRFTHLKKITFNNFTSINDGTGDSPAVHFTSDTQEVEINGMTIIGSGNTGILIQASGEARITDLEIDGCSKGVDSNTDTTINGISIKNANPALDVRGSSSWEVSGVEFTGNGSSSSTAIRIESGSVVEVSDCDFNGVSDDYMGNGTFKYKETN